VWEVDAVTLDDCDLVYHESTAGSGLVLGTEEEAYESWLIDCRILGFSSTSDLLSLHRGTYHSYDFLYDLDLRSQDSTIVWLTEGNNRADLKAYWSIRAHAHWQNQMAIEGVEVLRRDSMDNEDRVMTGTGGFTPYSSVLTEWSRSYDGYVSYLPIEFSIDLAGLTGRRIVNHITDPLTVDISVVDLKPPRIVIDQGSIVYVNTSNLVLTGQVFDQHSGVAFLEGVVLPSVYRRITVDMETGEFEANFTVRIGFQTVAFRLYDAVGNRKIRTVEVYYSTAPPYLMIDEPANEAWVNTSLIYLVGMTEPNSTLETQGRIQQIEKGTFRFLVYLDEGINRIVLNVTNLAGNRNSTIIFLYLDTAPPSLDITNPISSPHSTRDSRIEIRGSTDPEARVFINSVELLVDGEGDFANNVSLKDGTKRYLVIAMDQAGNTAVSELVFYIDSEPPSLEVIVEGMDAFRFIDDGLLRTSALNITIQVSTDVGTYLEVGGERIVFEGDTVTVVYPLEEGLQDIMVYAEDPAGNSVQIGPINVEVDRSPPSLNLNPGLPTITEEALFTLLGTSEANVTVHVNGAQVSVDFQGRFMRNFLLSEGHNHLLVVAEDRYGQVSIVEHDVEMSPSVPPPVKGADSNLFPYLAISAVILITEALLLQLWWNWRGLKKTEEA
jgi:hypothetical protein